MTITRAPHPKKYTFDNIEVGEKFGPVEGVLWDLKVKEKEIQRHPCRNNPRWPTNRKGTGYIIREGLRAGAPVPGTVTGPVWRSTPRTRVAGHLTSFLDTHARLGQGGDTVERCPWAT